MCCWYHLVGLWIIKFSFLGRNMFSIRKSWIVLSTYLAWSYATNYFCSKIWLKSHMLKLYDDGSRITLPAIMHTINCWCSHLPAITYTMKYRALLSAHLCQHQHLYVDIISYPVAYYMLAGHYWTRRHSASSSQLGWADSTNILYVLLLKQICKIYFLIL